MKGITRTIVWWPESDAEIEEIVRCCYACQHQDKAPPVRAPLSAWEWPEKPWSRLYVDYAGPFMGARILSGSCGCTHQMDQHLSQWHILFICNYTVKKLRDIFATHGLKMAHVLLRRNSESL